MTIFKTWTYKDRIKKSNPELFNAENKTNLGVYNDRGDTLGEQMKRFHWVHFFLKYKIVVPGIKHVVSLFRKKLVTEIPNRKHLEYLKLFNEAIDDAQVNWNEIFRKTKSDTFKPNYNDASNLLIKDMKNIMNTIIVHDTAYIELLHFIMVNIMFKMNKHYEKNKNKHLMYISRNVEDVAYFALFPHIDGPDKKVLKEVGKVKK